MDTALNVLGTLSLLAAGLTGVESGPAVRGTTLTIARKWAIVALAAWGFAWGVFLVPTGLSARVRDQLWYGVALLALCPPLAVLGARRPTTRVWPWFVLLPMLAVLGWPALTMWLLGGDIRPLRLEAPALVGFALVLLMGAGNYVGGRFTLTSCLFVVSACLIIAPFWAVAPANLFAADRCRQWGTVLLGLAAAGAFCPLRGVGAGEPNADSLWRDFRNLFGIVWSRRIQERINQTAHQERWAARLAGDGFQPVEGDNLLSAEQTRGRIDHTLRWLLRRFADEAWIEQRLGGGR